MILLAAVACSGGSAGVGSSPPASRSPGAVSPSPSPTPLDAVELRDALREKLTQELVTRLQLAEPPLVILDFREIELYGQSILVAFLSARNADQKKIKDNADGGAWAAIAVTVSTYRSDLERLGYGYIGWEVDPEPTAVGVLAWMGKTSAWADFGAGAIGGDEFKEALKLEAI